MYENGGKGSEMREKGLKRKGGVGLAPLEKRRGNKRKEKLILRKFAILPLMNIDNERLI